MKDLKPLARRNKLAEFKGEKRTVIFYESPYRVLKTLKDLNEVLDNPEVVCGRGLTKKFAEVRKGKARELFCAFYPGPTQR